MSQYTIFFNGTPIEYTGYFKSIRAVRAYIKARYSKHEGITFRACYPQLGNQIFSL